VSSDGGGDGATPATDRCVSGELVDAGDTLCDSEPATPTADDGTSTERVRAWIDDRFDAPGGCCCCCCCCKRETSTLALV